MRKLSLLLLAFVCSASLFAQTTILDHEAPATTNTFTYFGNCFLDATPTAVITNPDVSGVNTSANVGEFVRASCALTFAGCFGDPAPASPVDLTTDNVIRMKVWMDHVGTFTLKLEGSVSAPNWEQTISVSTPNTWVDLTFDGTLPSGAAPFNVAAGEVYTQVVLFTDLGSPATGVDQVTYFDDIITDFATPSPDPVVDFSVDMNNETGFSTVHVFGTFNGFDATANELTDPDGDGIYTTSITMPAGSYEYLYLIDGVQESFNGTEGCIPDNGTGFWNRAYTASADLTLDLVCYNSCYACDADLVTITIDLGLNGAVADPGGIYLAGGGNFGVPGGPYQMTDPDLDGIYSISFQRLNGFSSYYAFANGACIDFSCKENLAGQPCADPTNFNDRFMGPVTADLTISTCLGICSDDASTCAPQPCSSADAPVGLVSTVVGSTVTLAWDAVWQSVACQINGGPSGGGAGNLNLIGSEVSSTTIGGGALTSGTTYDWKVRCTCSLPPGPIDATAFSAINSFTTLSPREIQESVNLVSVAPNPASDMIQIYITADGDANEMFQIVDIAGAVHGVWNAQTKAGLNQIEFNVSNLPNGLYLIQQVGKDASEAKKFYIQH